MHNECIALAKEISEQKQKEILTSLVGLAVYGGGPPYVFGSVSSGAAKLGSEELLTMRPLSSRESEYGLWEGGGRWGDFEGVRDSGPVSKSDSGDEA